MHVDTHKHTDLYIYPSHTSGSRETFSVDYFHAERKDFLNRVWFSKPEDVMSGFRTMDLAIFNLHDRELYKVIVQSPPFIYDH